MSFVLPQADWMRYSLRCRLGDDWRRLGKGTRAGRALRPQAHQWRCHRGAWLATWTTQPMRPCVSTVSVSILKTIETTTRRGQKSVCDGTDAALQQESVEPPAVLESDRGEPPGIDASADDGAVQEKPHHLNRRQRR